MNGALNALAGIYTLFRSGGGARLPLIEHHLGVSRPEYVGDDLSRNEREIYRTLSEDQEALNALFQRLLQAMRGAPHEACGEVLEALDFVQQVVATMTWKHHFAVNEQLEAFARAFDRLDIPSERRRLYEVAQATR